MDKTIAGLLGAVGALVASSPSQAAPLQPTEAVLHAASYSDLLRPVPNALETLRAIDQSAPEGQLETASQGAIEQVQYDHHHHHHHRYYRRRYHHHHHHHHHHGSVFR